MLGIHEESFNLAKDRPPRIKEVDLPMQEYADLFLKFFFSVGDPATRDATNGASSVLSLAVAGSEHSSASLG